MAPEQARGDPVDARADVFSLGVVLWELCAGRRLFARDTDAAALAALLGPDPVSPASGWNESIPPELDEVLRGALEKDPARRTASAEDLARSLSRLLLRMASGPEDWDLRGFMHRLWPEEARPAAGASEVTRVRGPAASPAPSPGATGAEDATRTAPPGSGARGWRPAVAGAVLAAAAAGGAVLWGRPGPPPAGPLPGDPAAAPSPPRSGGEGEEGGRPPAGAAAPPSAAVAPSAGERGAPPPAAKPAAPTRIRSVPGTGGLPLPPRTSGEGLVFVNATPWAELSVNGRPVGDTPRTVQLPAGKYRFQVRHPKFGTVDSVIEVRAGVQRSWTPDLTR
jgi:serine/threonine-protein kinase